MAIERKLLAHDDNDDNQWLKIDHLSRYIVNSEDDWQFLFGVDSNLSASVQIIKIGAKLDTTTFDNIKLTAYLYSNNNGSVANASSCVFRLFKVETTTWTETLKATINGSLLFNNYFYANPTFSSLSDFNFDGEDTLMVEAEIIRNGVKQLDRVYINHLGIYDSVVRLKQDINFLELTKKDE